MKILGVDPGTTQSGYVLFDGRVLQAGVMPNEDLLKIIADDRSDVFAIERIVSYGTVVGDETFQTVHWAGRFQQAWACPDEVRLIRRLDVKKSLGLMGSAKDKHVNAALLEQIGPKGTKANPGPTYGVASHAWAALGIAVTVMRSLP
jgi:hypothetical protein